MSSLSQFFGGGSVPIGGFILAPDMPTNFTQNGMEFLRTGSVKTYDSSYANSIAVAPHLRVFIENATSLSAVGSTIPHIYGYVGSNYVQFGNTIGYSSNLTTWTNSTGTMSTSSHRAANNGNSHIVIPAGAANTAHKYSTDGVTFTAVAGTFTTHPIKTAIAYGNSIWVSLSTMNATAGEMSYINNVSPTGTWTIGTATNIGMTAAKAIAFGGSGNWFVAVGTSASGTAGKLAVSTSPSAGWTDYTSSSGISFTAAGSTINDVIFDGTVFIALVDGGKIYTATNPTGTWTLQTFNHDSSDTDYIGANTNVSTYPCHLATNGSGTTVMMIAVTIAACRYLMYKSTDNGVTWVPFQYYPKSAIGNTIATQRVSYVNGKFIANVCATGDANIDLGTITTPVYIGFQRQIAQGYYVRIK